jgi:hypothetical protein
MFKTRSWYIGQFEPSLGSFGRDAIWIEADVEDISAMSSAADPITCGAQWLEQARIEIEEITSVIVKHWGGWTQTMEEYMEISYVILMGM